IGRAEEPFIAAQGFAKGSMNLIDAARAEALYAAMGPAIESSGGSAGNTMAGVASLGSRGAYIGKVPDDHLGAVFPHDMTPASAPPAAAPAPATARCVIRVPRGGRRRRGTYGGACVEGGPDDSDEALTGAARFPYLEGFLFAPPQAQNAFYKAAAIAHAAGRR